MENAVQEAIAAIENDELWLESEKQKNIDLNKANSILAKNEKELWHEKDRKKFHLFVLAQILDRIRTCVKRIGVIENALFFLKTSVYELATTPESDEQKRICLGDLKTFCQSLQDYFNCDTQFEHLNNQHSLELIKVIERAEATLSLNDSSTDPNQSQMERSCFNLLFDKCRRFREYFINYFSFFLLAILALLGIGEIGYGVQIREDLRLMGNSYKGVGIFTILLAIGGSILRGCLDRRPESPKRPLLVVASALGLCAIGSLALAVGGYFVVMNNWIRAVVGLATVFKMYAALYLYTSVSQPFYDYITIA